MYRHDLASFQETMGAEEFGPERPTVIQATTQVVTDLTGLQKNMLYAIGAGILGYIGYRMYYGE